MPTYIDPTLDHPASDVVTDEAVTLPVRARLLADVVGELGRRRVPLLEGEIPAVEAQAQLATWREVAEEILIAVARRRSAAEWLWHARRVPTLFDFNDLESTAPYCRRLAEVACGASTAAPPGSYVASYPVSARVIKDLVLLQEAVGLVYDLHATYRWAGKDAPVLFNGGEPPSSNPNEDLRYAVRRYDELNAASPSGILAQAGSGHVVGLRSIEGSSPVIPVLLDLRERTLMPIPAADPGSREYHVPSQHVFTMFMPEKVRALARHTQEQLVEVWSAASPALILLHLSWLHPDSLVDGDGAPAPGLVNTMKIGYQVSHRANLASRLRWALAEAPRLAPYLPPDILPESAEAAIEQISAIPQSLWPPSSGTVILDMCDSCIINWSASTAALLNGVKRIEQGGSVANAWAFAFEEDVRELVDLSPWRPPSALRDLVGRHLRVDGHEVTDVDAMGVLGNTVLLISCLSSAASEEYLRGDFAATRNLRTSTEDKVAAWDVKIDRLRKTPKGDNFDFTGMDIHGVVVVPFRPFLHRPLLDRTTVSGIPMVCTPDDLAGALGRT